MPLSAPSKRLKRFAFLWKWAAINATTRGIYSYTLVQML